MYTIVFKKENDTPVTLENISPLQTLLDVALDNNLNIPTLCGGVGVCKSCFIRVEKGCQYVEGDFEDTNGIYACQAILMRGLQGQLIIQLE